MTLDEVLHRIVRAHIWLICACLLIPVAVVGYMQSREVPDWEARIRLQVLTSDPVSPTQAEALSSRVLALATTPSILRQSFKDAKVKRNAVEFSDHHVAGARLGESSVVELSVTDRSRAAATAIASALASHVIERLNSPTTAGYTAAIKAVDTQLAAAVARSARQQQAVDRTGNPDLRAVQVQQLQTLEDAVGQLREERATLQAALLSKDRADLVDNRPPAVAPVDQSPIPRLALAILLGLAVGLALASILETLRPRSSGVRSVARSLDGPVLSPKGGSVDALRKVASMAARRQGVETLVLVGIDGKDSRAATQLLSALNAPRPREMSRQPVPTQDRGHRDAMTPDDPDVTGIRFCGLDSISLSDERGAGVAVITSGTVGLKEVEATRDLIRTLRWPLVGLVDSASTTHRGRR